jgi:hypothetical protein
VDEDVVDSNLYYYRSLVIIALLLLSSLIIIAFVLFSLSIIIAFFLLPFRGGTIIPCY